MGTCACCPVRRQDGGRNAVPHSADSGAGLTLPNESSGNLGPVSLRRRVVGLASAEQAEAAARVENAMLRADTQRRRALSECSRVRRPASRPVRRGAKGHLDTMNITYQLAKRAAQTCVVCNACGARLMLPADRLGRSATPLQPVIDDAVDVQDLVAVAVNMGGDIGRATLRRRGYSSLGHAAVAAVEASSSPTRPYPAILPPSVMDRNPEPPPLQRVTEDGVLEYSLSAAKCWQCRRFVGVCVTDCAPRPDASGSQVCARRRQIRGLAAPPGRSSCMPASWPLRLRLSFVGLRYTRLIDISTGRSVLPRAPLRCVACSEVLSWTDALLCTKRRWGFRDGPSQGACYLGAISESVRAKSQREERLAQGRFLMEDLFCRCGKQVGYKFVRDLSRDQRNVNQVGRYGLVISCFRIGEPESA